MAAETRVGYDFAHAIVDDHSRLAYVDLHPDERAATVTAFVPRALAWFEHQGARPRRLMTDNAFSYVKNRSLREVLARRGVRHLTTEPYCSRSSTKNTARSLRTRGVTGSNDAASPPLGVAVPIG